MSVRLTVARTSQARAWGYLVSLTAAGSPCWPKHRFDGTLAAQKRRVECNLASVPLRMSSELL